MDNANSVIPTQSVDDLYTELGEWHVNVGEKKIYPKRMGGVWRRVKNWSGLVWLVFFLGPYIRWGDRQAVLFDLPSQQFHLFGLTVLPQDLWILAYIMLFFAILLAVVTAVAGRVFCGYFCFQTVWTDIYVWIEERLEGPPRQRQKLDAAPWTAKKLRLKTTKHMLWLLIALLTGMSFVAWFMDAFELWQGLLSGSLPQAAWITIGSFIAGTYLLAGFMREQTCLWLCPYSRIQSVMMDEDTLLPAYDAVRGEPRGRLKKKPDATIFATENGLEQDHSLVELVKQAQGDCIDCNLCVAVCPTGIDIRHGQQQGCITCGLCIDACDSVMEKIGKAKGLVRYDSLKGLRGLTDVVWFKRARLWVYVSILAFSISSVVYGLSSLDALELKVIQNRLPLFVMQSDGSIQNRYRIKILNKTDKPGLAIIKVEGAEGIVLKGAEQAFEIRASGVTAHDLYVRIPLRSLSSDTTELLFMIKTQGEQPLTAERLGVFSSP